MPARSGVAGGVLAVVNRQLGIGTYSPRLDRFGNSVRGTEVCIDLASRLGLHVVDCVNVGSSFLDAILWLDGCFFIVENMISPALWLALWGAA